MRDPYWSDGRIKLWQGNALALPLEDASVDLVVTSPPYFSLRSYKDGGEHMGGQIGDEATPTKYVDALIAATREMVRVLRPSGSIWVNLGDKYAERTGPPRRGTVDDDETVTRPMDRPQRGRREVPAKSLMDLPARYVIRCVDELGLIHRADVVWEKPNGMPESADDRCRRSHELLLHLTKRPLYYEAVDTIREDASTYARKQAKRSTPPGQRDRAMTDGVNPLGRLPGTVWSIPTQPLLVPDRIAHEVCCGGVKRAGCEDGLDHYAAFPMELPRRIIRGWCPRQVCTKCGEGRRPWADRTPMQWSPSPSLSARSSARGGTYRAASGTMLAPAETRILGWVCACTPSTRHPGTGEPSPTAGANGKQATRPADIGVTHHRVGPWTEYHLDQWTPAPTTPGVVLDPFGGTGTTALVGAVEGMTVHSVDLSSDYCRLSKWRVTDPDQIAQAMQVAKPPRELDGQLDMLALMDA